MKTHLTFMILLLSLTSTAQVDEIKNASEKNAGKSGKSAESLYDTDDSGSFFLFEVMFHAIPEWQRIKLRENRERYPAMVSLDVYMQGAVKPSAYYILWPRIRGNWGLFSTDFRMNYLIEEDIDGGYQHIRTNDWQILQMNLITSRFITFRLGTGIMQEAFGSKESFNEWDFIFGVHAPDQTKALFFEYRFAKDWDTGSNPRREFNFQYQHRIFVVGNLNGYISAGGVYQKYYNSIEIWGVQAGLIFRIF